MQMFCFEDNSQYIWCLSEQNKPSLPLEKLVKVEVHTRIPNLISSTNHKNKIRFFWRSDVRKKEQQQKTVDFVVNIIIV